MNFTEQWRYISQAAEGSLPGLVDVWALLSSLHVARNDYGNFCMVSSLTLGITRINESWDIQRVAWVPTHWFQAGMAYAGALNRACFGI
jgi:hypothetical protein